MSKVNLVPQPHSVFNEFDRHGLLLGLERLTRERNSDYKARLVDVFVNRANSSYRGLINGITRELGLSLSDVMTIKPVVDAEGNPLATMPAVVFEETKVYLYSDFQAKTLITTLDRFDTSSDSYTIAGFIEDLEGTGYFEAILEPNADTTKRSMTIFNQSSIKEVSIEDVSGKGSKIILEGRNIVPDTFIIRSSNLTQRRTALLDLRRSGDYYVDLATGTLFTVSNPAPGSFVSYIYRDDEFLVQSSPVIIHDLQSEDFKTKMFETVCDDAGEDCNGLPTVLGAEIINELLSVHPTSWGT